MHAAHVSDLGYRVPLLGWMPTDPKQAKLVCELVAPVRPISKRLRPAHDLIQARNKARKEREEQDELNDNISVDY